MRLSSTVVVLCSAFPLFANAQTAEESAPAAAPSASPPAAEAAPAPALAQPSPEVTVAAPTIAAELTPAATPATAPPIAFGWEALVDAYYLVNFTGKPNTLGPRARQFDTTANNFALNYAKLGVHADTQWVTFRMDLGAGHTASIINGASQASSAAATDTAATDTASMYGNGFLVQQAFAELKPHPMVSIDAGRFVTSASAEVIEANKNWLYSRSLLFFGVPLLHTGLRLNVAALGTIAAPELVLSLQLVNGWNNDPDINSNKTFGANVTYTPANLGLTAAATTYIGKEVPGAETTMLLDGVFLKDIGPVSVGANLDYFKTGDIWWFGGAGMGRYTINDYFNVAARFEYVYSKNQGYGGTGATGLFPTPDIAASASIYEITGQAAFTMDKHYELRLEVRADMSNKEIFVKDANAAPPTSSKNQVTGLIAALAYF
jgi:hypothetical protein